MTRAIIFFILALVGLYWAAKILFFPKRKTIKAQKAMAFTLFCVSALLCDLGLYSVPGLEGNIVVDFVHVVIAPLCPFFYYLFIRFLTAREGVRAKDFAFLLPILAIWGLILGLDFGMGAKSWEDFINLSLAGKITEGGLTMKLSYWLLKVFLAVEFAAAFFYGNYRMKIYHSEVENYYSELIGFADSMDRYTGIYTWIAMFLCIVLCISTNTISIEANPLIVVILLGAAVVLYYVGNYSYGIEQSTEDLVEMLERDNKLEAERKAKEAAEIAAGTGSAKSSLAKYSAALKEALDQQVYLEPGLELVDLAERLGTNRTYLSNIIHDEYGQNFAEFVNSRRIKYAIELMQQSDEQYPMRYVAVKCGYSSLQTFYSNFARYTGGKTPASFLKK